MSVLPESPTSQAVSTNCLTSEQLASIHLEPRFTPATDSQLLIIDTALRLLAVWAVRRKDRPNGLQLLLDFASPPKR